MNCNNDERDADNDTDDDNHNDDNANYSTHCRRNAYKEPEYYKQILTFLKLG